MTIFNISLLEEKKQFDEVFMSKKPSNVKDIIPEIELRLNVFGFNKQTKERFKKIGLFKSTWESTLNRVMNSKTYLNYTYGKNIIYTKYNFRKVVELGPGPEKDKEYYQHKIKKSDNDKEPYSFDFNIISKFNFKNNIYINPEVYNIKLAKSYEVSITKQTYDSISGREDQFLRERHSFEYKDFIIDFSRRVLSDKNSENYELEIELKPSFIQENIIKSYKISSFFDIMKQSLSIVFPTIHSLFFESYYNSVISRINNVLENSPRENKPVNIQDVHLTTGFHNFSVTNKLDGVGYNLIFVEFKDYINIFLQNKKDIWKLYMFKSKTKDESILSILNSNTKSEVRILRGEATEPEIEINIYDCTLFNEKINDKELSYRYNICKNIYEFCKNLNIVSPSGQKNVIFKVKEYFYDTDFKTNINRVVSYMYKNFGKNVIKENDGVIFQYNGDYNTFPPYKWKFPSLITIDFTLKKLSLVDNESNKITYQLLSLYDNYKLDRFSLTKLENKGEDNDDPLYIIKFNSNDLLDGYKTTELENLVVECSFDISNYKWIAHRIRFDKNPSDSNYITVAISTFADIMNRRTLPELVHKVSSIRLGESIPLDSAESQPRGEAERPDVLPGPELTEPPQRTDCLKNFRKVSNLIKGLLVEKYSNSKKIILDIGAGKGGDLPKYQKYGIKKLYAVEPSQTNIDEFKERLQKTYKSLLDKVQLIYAKGEEKDKIQSFISDKLDIIFMFYSMSFFFKDKETLQNLIDLVVFNLTDDSNVFSGTMMEGSLIEDTLLLNNEIKKECYDIKAVSVQENKVFDQQITIDYKGTETATFQLEYLAYYQELERLLVQYDFIGQFRPSYTVYIGRLASSDLKLDNDEEELIKNYIDFNFIKNKKIYKSMFKPSRGDITFQLYPVKTRGYEFWFRRQAINDGSCFFHSVLMLLLGKDYSKEDVYNLRKKIADDFQLDTYIKLQDGQNAIIEFETLLVDTVNINCFDVCPFKNNKELKDFISEKLNIFHREKGPYVISVNIVIDFMVKEMVEVGFDKEESKLILNAYVYHNFENFLKFISNYNVWAEFWMIIYLQQYLKINIIVIDSNTYYPINVGLNYNNEYVSIVLLNVDNKHFEPLVRRTLMFKPNDDRNNIDMYQSTFTLEELSNIL